MYTNKCCTASTLVFFLSLYWILSSSSQTSRYTSKACRLQVPFALKTYLWKVPSIQIAEKYENKKKSKCFENIILPTTVLFGPKAQIQAHSGGTVKFARAHWDSP